MTQFDDIDISTKNVGVHRGLVVVHSCGIHGTHRMMDFSCMNTAATWEKICKAYDGCRDRAELDGWGMHQCEGGLYWVLNRPGMDQDYWCLAEDWFAEKVLQAQQNEDAHDARR